MYGIEHKRLRKDDALPGSFVPSLREFELVVIGSSLGGPSALAQLLTDLPSNFGAGVVIAQHVSERFPSRLAELLDRASPLQVEWAEDMIRIRPGHVYVAPPGRHAIVTGGARLRLSDSARVQFSRPSVDVLFTSAARYYSERLIGVVLTGMGRDGAHGAAEIKERGGRVLVQEPRSARGMSMPTAAISAADVDFVLPLGKIPAALTTFVMIPGAAALFRTERERDTAGGNKRGVVAYLPLFQASSRFSP